jgi:hypothetical protein
MVNKTKKNIKRNKISNKKGGVPGDTGPPQPGDTGPPPPPPGDTGPTQSITFDDEYSVSEVQPCQQPVQYCPGKMIMTIKGRKCVDQSSRNEIDLKTSPQANQEKIKCKEGLQCFNSEGKLLTEFDTVQKSLVGVYDTNSLEQFKGKCYSDQQNSPCMIIPGLTGNTDTCGEKNFCSIVNKTCQPRIDFDQVCNLDNKVKKLNNSSGICNEGLQCSKIGDTPKCIRKVGQIKEPCVKTKTGSTCGTDLQCIDNQCELKTKSNLQSTKSTLKSFVSRVPVISEYTKSGPVVRKPSYKPTDYLVRQFEPIINYLKEKYPALDEKYDLKGFVTFCNANELVTKYQELYGTASSQGTVVDPAQQTTGEAAVEPVQQTTQNEGGRKKKKKYIKYGGSDDLDTETIIQNIIIDNIKMLFYVIDTNNDNSVSKDEINSVIVLNAIKLVTKEDNGIDKNTPLDLKSVRNLLYTYDNNPSVQLKKELWDKQLVQLDTKQNPKDVTALWNQYFKGDNLTNLKDILSRKDLNDPKTSESDPKTSERKRGIKYFRELTTEDKDKKVKQWKEGITEFGYNAAGLQKYLSQPFNIDKSELKNLLRHADEHITMDDNLINIVKKFINVNETDDINEAELLSALNIIDSLTDGPTKKVYVGCDGKLNKNDVGEIQNIVNKYGKTVTGTGIQLQEISLNLPIDFKKYGFFGETSKNKRNNLNDPIHDVSAQVILIRESLKQPSETAPEETSTEETVVDKQNPEDGGRRRKKSKKYKNRRNKNKNSKKKKLGKKTNKKINKKHSKTQKRK